MNLKMHFTTTNFIFNHINIDREYITKIFRHYSIAVSVIAFLGIVEFLFPEIMANIFDFSEAVRPSMDSIFFNRLAFLYWGTHLAVKLIPPFFPLPYSITKNKSIVHQK